MTAFMRALDFVGGVVCLVAGLATLTIGVAVLARDMSFSQYFDLYVDLGQFAVGWALVTAGITATWFAAGICFRALPDRPWGVR